MRLVSTIVISAFLLSGCARNVVVDSSCDSFRVIHPSRQDTTETQRQVLAHNKIWEHMCNEQ